MENFSLKGIIVDIDYINIDQKSRIRITFKSDTKYYNLIDMEFMPYFYLVPHNQNINLSQLEKIHVNDETGEFFPAKIEEKIIMLKGKNSKVIKVSVFSTKHIQKFSQIFKEFGECFEHDIIFWKRYLIDKGISPLNLIKVDVDEIDARICIKSIKNIEDNKEIPLSHLSFDIETYNPVGMPRPDKDPAIMISYTDGDRKGVMTTKNPEEDFVEIFEDEKSMINGFVELIKNINPDIIVGYNSSNFDLPYLKNRSNALNIKFDIGRIEGEVRGEHHGLIEAYKIPGRINLDIFNVAKFVAVVGAAEQLIKVNSFKLMDIYAAVTGKEKKMVERMAIWQIWDNEGNDLKELAKYSLGDAVSLNELFDFFIPLEIEVSKVSGTTLGEASISTTGQLVEFMLMKNAHENNHVIPNRPDEHEINARIENPFEGAYVKEPDAGIYDNIVVFDFKGLYPSIIISHNIDNFTLCEDCEDEDVFIAPDGTKFRKNIEGVIPKVLKYLFDERNRVKKIHKQNPDDKRLTARYQALKILANSFYGYMGYPRSRWYSRKCAASVTSYGRQYITDVISKAEKKGFKVLYADTDSIFLVLNEKKKKDAEIFVQGINSSLPSGMELELEDFYLRGVFVGKRGSSGGAKKKYAMLSESGKIKIKGFELVRRDWSKIARDTQKAVLETILKKGNKEEAAAIVKEVVEKLKNNKVDIKDLVMHTQLRKGLGNYDIKSPEVAAARKAVQQGIKTKEEMEKGVIGYVITKNGNTISEKAEIEEMAKNYDADYYINHQIIPSTMKILKELGYDAEQLKSRGSQKKL
jgi:DNA polymerase I